VFDLRPTDPDSRALPEERRVALALAEAIIPGGAGIRPADELTLKLTEEVTDHVSPWATKAFRAAMGLLRAGR